MTKHLFSIVVLATVAVLAYALAYADRLQGSIDQASGKRRIPPGGEVEVTLQTDHLQVRQVSVHAGKEAWGKSLNTKNDEVQIVSIDVLPR
jgi:hypothetical protein